MPYVQGLQSCCSQTPKLNRRTLADTCRGSDTAAEVAARLTLIAIYNVLLSSYLHTWLAALRMQGLGHRGGGGGQADADRHLQ